jgi:hypothetical protein
MKKAVLKKLDEELPVNKSHIRALLYGGFVKNRAYYVASKNSLGCLQGDIN